MSSFFEVHDIGSIGDDTGKISVSYTPEYGSVTLRASIPSDKRKADILVRVGTTALRDLANQLETAITSARRKREQAESLSFEADGISLVVMNTKLFVPNNVFKRISELIDAGSNDAVLREVKIGFPLLTDKAVSELALLIYKHKHPRA